MFEGDHFADVFLDIVDPGAGGRIMRGGGNMRAKSNRAGGGGARSSTSSTMTMATLHQALRRGKREEVAALLASAGPGGHTIINARDSHGATAVHVACQLGHLALVKLLVERGGDVTLHGEGGVTVLHLAAAHGHTDVVSYLLSTKKVDVHAQTDQGRSALALAVFEEHEETVEALLSAGATMADVIPPSVMTMEKGGAASTAYDNSECVKQEEVSDEAKSARNLKRREKKRKDKGKRQAAGQQQQEEEEGEGGGGSAEGEEEEEQRQHEGEGGRAEEEEQQKAAAAAVSPPSLSCVDAKSGEAVVATMVASMRVAEEEEEEEEEEGEEGEQQQQEADVREGGGGDVGPSIHPAAPPPTTTTTTGQKTEENASPTNYKKEEEEGEGEKTAAVPAMMDDRQHFMVDSDHLLCPISFEFMTDPVIASDGNTYQREAMQAWIDKCEEENRPLTSPLTGLSMSSSELKPNNLVRSLVLESLQKAAR